MEFDETFVAEEEEVSTQPNNGAVEASEGELNNSDEPSVSAPSPTIDPQRSSRVRHEPD